MQMRPPKNSWSSTSARTVSCWSALYLGLTSFIHSSPLCNHHLSPQPNYPPSLSILGRYLRLLRSQMTEVREHQFNSLHPHQQTSLSLYLLIPPSLLHWRMRYLFCSQPSTEDESLYLCFPSHPLPSSIGLHFMY